MFRLEIKGILRVFLSNLSLYQSRVFRAIEPIAVVYPSLVSELIPAMTQLVKDSEVKRGVGIDKQLRYVQGQLF